MQPPNDDERLERAIRAFDAQSFCDRHGGYKESVQDRSREWLLPCPSCGSDRLRWRHEPGVKTAWICWGCRQTGGPIELIMLMEGVSRMDAIGYLVDGYVGGDAPTKLQQTATIRKPVERTRLERLPPIQYPKGVETIRPLPMHPRVWQYLHYERGLFPPTVLGYRLAVGLRGRLRDYVVFPVFMDGALVYYQGRAMWNPPSHLSKVAKKEWAKATGYRKTLNPLSVEGNATASEVLFNYDRARAEPHVVICEGPVDAMKVGPHAVALLGKAESPQKIERLLRMNAQQYTVYLDNGEEEQEAAWRIARELSGFAPVSIATAPQGFDAGALSPEQNQEVIRGARPMRSLGLSSGLKPK